MPPRLDGLPPELEPRFTVQGRLGEGAFGVVLRAHDTRCDAPVALKLLTLPPGDPEAVERFQREARVTASLRHPHIVALLDHGVLAGGRAYLAYELIEGESLASRMERGRVPGPQVKAWGVALAGALAVVHAEGVVHRDVKPANVMLRPDSRPVLCDFGLARVADGACYRTATGRILGTPATMAPELFEGRPATPLSDEFALAATLYEALTGTPVYPSQDLGEIVRLAGAAGPLVVPRTSGGLEEVLARALARDPGARYPSLVALAEALAGVPEAPEAGATSPLGPAPLPVAAAPAAGATVERGPPGPDVGPPRARAVPLGPRVLAALSATVLVAALVVDWTRATRIPREVRYRALGDTLLVEHREGTGCWLEVAGQRVEAHRTVGADGRVQLRWVGLPVAGEAVVRLVWEGGAEAPVTLRSGAPPVEGAPRLTPGQQVLLRISRPVRGGWTWAPAQPLGVGEHAVPVPTGLGPTWRFEWEEEGLVVGRDYAASELLRALERRTAVDWAGAEELADRLVRLPLGQLEEAARASLGEGAGAGASWAPEILAVLTAPEAQRFHHRLQGFRAIQAALEAGGGRALGPRRPLGLPGTWGHGPPPEGFGGPVVLELTPVPKVEANGGGLALAPELAPGIPSNADACTRLEFRWPASVPPETPGVAITLIATIFGAGARVDLEAEGRAGPLRLGFFPSRDPALKKNWGKHPTIVIPMALAPEAGTLVTLRARHFSTAIPEVIRVRSVWLRWAPPVRSSIPGPSPAGSRAEGGGGPG